MIGPQCCVLENSFIIIIFKALKLAATVFMYFFNLAAAERPQHCALVVKEILLIVFFEIFFTMNIQVESFDDNLNYQAQNWPTYG